MPISKADTVVSLAGRDKGRLFFVLEVQEGFALIADGKIRPMEKPKRKKLKHLQLAAHTESHVADKIRKGDSVLNSELRRDLAIFGQEFHCQNQGGE